MKTVLATAVAAIAITISTAGGKTMGSIYDIGVTTITGEATTLADYRGKVLLIVNVASKCGFTGQYDGLQKLYESYSEKGLVILGFPSNDFMGQEPGTSNEIAEFCRLNYGVTFPLFEKVTVKKGKNQHPLYTYLTEKATNPNHAGKIAWNFNKFLISRDGVIVQRFGSRDAPEDPAVVTAIEAALASGATE
jgi:glutathione peroxidase